MQKPQENLYNPNNTGLVEDRCVLADVEADFIYKNVSVVQIDTAFGLTSCLNLDVWK